MDFSLQEKKDYLLKYMAYYIDDYFEQLLNDSKTQPEYSAVTATNLLRCYIDVVKSYGKECPYDDLKSYFVYHSFSKKDYLEFEHHRKKETRYYRGPIID
ncbi:MAG: hypothetical protein IJK98_03555 [Clostridia bacterium]|nr:hypothetical protein [Clostridia bacterium]